MKATNAHISINGHVTREELRARLDALDAANGWGNRFLFCATRRARRLPAVVITDEDLAPHASELALGIAWAREHNPCLRWGDEAFREWCAFYNAASDDVRGIVGALTARSEAHVLRLALMYAVADRSAELRREHLDAARAVWRYCEDSVAWIWEGKLGDPDAERILEPLRAAGLPGMSRTSIRDLFSHDKDARAIDDALALLADHRLAVARMVPTGGRSAQWWWAAEHFAESQGPGTERDERDQSPPEGRHFGPFGPVRSRSRGFRERRAHGWRPVEQRRRDRAGRAALREPGSPGFRLGVPRRHSVDLRCLPSAADGRAQGRIPAGRKGATVRVPCDIGYVELENEDGYEVEGVCATCPRCGHETESYGTSGASVRRCLVLLREECPNDDRNYYFDASDQPERESPIAAYERGYAAGLMAAARAQAANERGQFDADQLRALVTLCHPDRHPPGRAQLANRVTARLLELLEQEREAA